MVCFNRLMDAATQSLVVIKQSPNLELKTRFLAWKECENSHTLTATTIGSKNSQKEPNNQTDNQNSVLCLSLKGEDGKMEFIPIAILLFSL